MPGFPVSEPFDSGLLDVGDGNRIYYEQVGNPEAIPVLYVHGGPGSGCSLNARGIYDPERFRTILFDQRNCGRSLPHAGDPSVDLSANTTQHLIADMELLREHLGVDKWLLNGGSWGSTLILAYAERHPERVTRVVISGVTALSPAAVSWWYEGTGRFFPAEYERFRDYIPAAERGTGILDLINAYGRLMTHPDAQVRARTAQEWLTWEDAIISLEPNGTRDNYRNRPDDAAAAFVRICAHYFGNGAFLEDGELIRAAGKLEGIPALLLHGRHDLGGPVKTAWDLARAWPGAELVIIEDSGHTGSPAFVAEARSGIDRLTAGL